MSLTSYRAAPPRVGGGWSWVVVPGLEDLAATYSPASWDAVPWALGFFTAEFGMGSGGGTPPWPPGRPAQGVVATGLGLGDEVLVAVCLVEGWPARWRSSGVDDCCA